MLLVYSKLKVNLFLEARIIIGSTPALIIQ